MRGIRKERGKKRQLQGGRRRERRGKEGRIKEMKRTSQASAIPSEGSAVDGREETHYISFVDSMPGRDLRAQN